MIDIFFNGQNARTKWKVIPGTGAMASLICPGPAKSYIVNDVRADHGKQYFIDSDVDRNMRVDERSFTITLYMLASSYSELYNNLDDLAKEVFEGGSIDIRTSMLPDITYHCVYKGCQQLTEFNGRLARFSLSLVEPNPKDRATKRNGIPALKAISMNYRWDNDVLTVYISKDQEDDVNRIVTGLRQNGNTISITDGDEVITVQITAWNDDDYEIALDCFKKYVPVTVG